MAEVVLDNVSRIFGKQRAVDRVSLKIEDGEFFTLLGPSGCGKTTTLRLIAGLETADEGLVRIGDRDVTHVPPARRRIAMVFQNYALYPHMTIAENISYPLRIKKVDQATIEKKVKEVSEKLKIGNLHDRRPAQISGGQQQRVAVARAMVQDPLVYLFDEPLSNLDAKLRLEARRFLKKIQRETGVTAVYVTHDQTEAMAMSHRVAVLKDGHIIQIASPDEIYSRPANSFVAGFVGSPPMNLISGEVHSGIFKSGRFSFMVKDAKSDYKCATLGIRPEHIKITGADEPLTIAAVIDDVEPLGAEIIVSAAVADVVLLVLCSSRETLKIGESVGIKIEPQNLHLFDEQGNRAI